MRDPGKDPNREGQRHKAAKSYQSVQMFPDIEKTTTGIEGG